MALGATCEIKPGLPPGLDNLNKHTFSLVHKPLTRAKSDLVESY